MADATQEDKNPVGRPLKFKTVDDLDQAIVAYFAQCDPHQVERLVDSGVDQSGQTIFAKRKVMTKQQPYTVSGLARALGIDRDTLINYKKRDEFFGSIQAAYDRCHEYAESQLFGKAAGGASFSLKNNWGWKDKSEVAVDSPNGLFGTSALTVKVIDGRDNTQSEATAGP